jgi:hypothetical protein
MVDTDLWNDDDIIENFTAEDKYFWLYLLTNPHNKICGVLKNSPALIARDMGLHKDTIVNLIYRFEKVHQLIVCDKETNEIFILNWYKFNWTKSPKIVSIIEKEKNEIKSEYIAGLIEDRLSIVFSEKEDTVSIPYRYPTNTDTNADTNTNNSVNYNSSSKNDYDLLIEIYNKQCFNLPSVIKVSESRKKAIAKFLKQMTTEDFEQACITANNTPFLCGQSKSGWKANFDFIIKVDNAAKIIEGVYSGEAKSGGYDFTDLV